ncbi:TetR/AcrR family transcriptional regulator [Mycolicibacterium peregrinum]|uniref:TetR/AcrR family transcriptional regulator n=2 Tax=Mycolicibacterium peregrinum TaxID=43304 RepID=A0A4Z0HRH4_MYCPR|nr:TetR/AcrR family transcriptional regulator [Mycolicibacterium peregrinum]TGB40908.1 TetR/AcrR family transcriptional regulator [Mycolicibacterium peregrinum]
MSAMRADAIRNRDRLVAAAAELFTERGVDVPLDEIARAAGVSIGTLYNHFPNRGALLDVVLSDRLAVIDRLARQALDDADPWRGFAAFLDGLFSMQASDRSINDAVARNPVGAVDVAGECGRAGGLLEAVVGRAREAGVLRADFGADDLATLMWAMSTVIAMADGDDAVWRRHLGFVLDGLKSPSGSLPVGALRAPADVGEPQPHRGQQ